MFSDQYNNMFPSWSNDGESIYFNSSREKSEEIWNYNLEDKSFKRITDDDGQYGQVNNDGYFYYTRKTAPYIWRKQVGENKPEMFFNKVHREDFNNWKVINNNIYFFRRTGSAASICVYNFKTQKETTLYTYGEKSKSYKMMMDIADNEKVLCFSSLERLEIDLMEIALE